ncbi:PREDICTED: probable disease resistance protein At5g66900-like [Fragaria vesca subsp. vesca]
MELLLRLQSSVDVLDDAMPNVKECFLDLGAFPEDAEIKVTALIDMWDKGLEVVHEAIDYSKYVVRQHDLLRELAIYNSKRGPMQHRERLVIEICGNNFTKWWRQQKYPYMNARLVSISTDAELSVKLPNLQLPEAEVLVLNFQSKTSYALPEFVERMDKLKLLLVINYSSLCEELDNFHLLGSLSNLRSVRLDGINCSCITKSPVQLKTVYKLYLREGRSFGENPLGSSPVFPYLKEMVIGACRAILRNGPVKLSHVFPNLKELVIDACDMRKLPAEQLIHLTKLKITNCGLLTDLPEEIGNMVSLEVLRIEHCPLLAKFPNSIGNLKKLKFLKISGTILFHKFPDSIANLVNLEVLNMKELPEQIGELKSLRKLQMSGCRKLRKLPHSVSHLEGFEEVICSEWAAEYLWTPFVTHSQKP